MIFVSLKFALLSYSNISASYTDVEFSHSLPDDSEFMSHDTYTPYNVDLLSPFAVALDDHFGY